MRSLQEALKLSLSDRKNYYQAKGIDKVIIDGNAFGNYGVYSYVREKSYFEEPTRSMGSGSMDNLNSYVTFITGHLRINFSIMPIDYYRKLMQLIYSKNEFVVECYDVVDNTVVTQKMFFTTEEMPKLWTIAHKLQGTTSGWEEWIELAGVEDYTVEMVGTNADMDYVSVMYYRNSPTNENDTVFRAEEDTYVGSLVVVGGAADFVNTQIGNFVFSHWNTQKDGNGRNVTNGAVETVGAKGLILYAQWQNSELHTLGYNYGLASVMTYTDTTTGEVVEKYSSSVQYGQSIGTLPTINSPKVRYNNTDYYPYKNGGWYRLPVKDEAARVDDNALYWTNRDDTLYLLFDKEKYSVSYVTNYDEYTIPTQNVEYGDTIWLPNLSRGGYTFGGWYIDSSFTQKLSSQSMPPYSITLYAKWTRI